MIFFFFKQKTAYEIMPSLVGSEMCIRDRYQRRVHGITVSSNSQVFSIFKGEVRKVIKIMGSNLAVLVRHGNYLSVYSNLTVVNVSVGQELTSYQKIGEINLQKGEETAILHFELWNENKTEDPSKWFKSVSYTHLTLPTICSVQISVVAGSLKKKTQNRADGYHENQSEKTTDSRYCATSLP
eukprot:TRINITY_DN2905_c0_g1_i1.p1 TRINITY_DN2905_c0_g1~~TRINITY_DN2905_c0_g1_i1.p1  ORF type:complete len:183 (+),score=40.89 TRINITY_DN2905_c0_g1_i1:76-624(+)